MIERVRELLAVEPFRPFLIQLADGREVGVHHRDLIAASPSGRTIVVLQPDDSMTIIDWTIVKDVSSKLPNKGHGKRRRKE